MKFFEQNIRNLVKLDIPKNKKIKIKERIKESHSFFSMKSKLSAYLPIPAVAPPTALRITDATP